MSKASKWRQPALRPPRREAGGGGCVGFSLEPARDVVGIELLAPEHAREGLSHHVGFVVGGARGRQLAVVLVGFGVPPRDDRVEVRPRRCRPAGRAKAEPQLDGRAGGHGDPVPERCLGAASVRVHPVGAPDDVVVDAVLGIGGRGLCSVEACHVGLVLTEEQARGGPVGSGCRRQLQLAQEGVLRSDDTALATQLRLGGIDVPAPGVAVPGGRQDVQDIRIRPCVGDADNHQQVRGVGLGVVHLDDPVAIIVEDTCVEQLVLRVLLTPSSVLLHESGVGELCLWVVVAPAVPGVTRRSVEVPPVLLGVLAVVALVSGQAEDALLEDGVTAVPEGQAQAQLPLHVREAGQPILAPAVGSRSGLVVREVLPGGAARAVILADGAPLALAEIRAPQVPVTGLSKPVLQTSERLDTPALRVLHGRGAQAVGRMACESMPPETLRASKPFWSRIRVAR